MKYAIVGLAALLVGISAHPSRAHFQELIPTSNILEGESQRDLALSAVFTHPMEGAPTMDMGRPVKFGVIGRDAERIDLLPALKQVSVGGKQAFTVKYHIPEPANYIFYIEPAPYWESSESKMLIHYTKVVVNAYGADDGWDQMTGAPIEIKPLTRPFGLWTNNVFSGVVY